MLDVHGKPLLGHCELPEAIADPVFPLSSAEAARMLRTARLGESSIDAIADAALALVHADDRHTAKPWCDTLLDEARARMRSDWEAPLDAVRAEIAYRDGDLRRAECHAERALSAIPPRRWDVRIALPLACLLRVSTELGNEGRAADLARSPVPAGAGDTRYGVLFRHARGRWHAAAGRARAALDDFLCCGEMTAKLRIDHPALVPWRSEAAQQYLRLGDHDPARALVVEELRCLGDSKSRARGITLTALALTSPLKTRSALLTEAAEILREDGDRLQLAHAMSKLGNTYYRLRDHRRARSLALRAENIARECHDVPPEPGKPSALSDAERRVAVLAGSGYTNKEIAQRLYITVSTVEQHLTSVYRKLSVRRRTELPARI